MIKLAILTSLLAALLLSSAPAGAAGQVHKCNINGTVTYQGEPCPSDAARQRPTVAQLNAERQKTLQKSRESMPAPTAGPMAPPPGSDDPGLPSGQPPARPALSAPARQSFACDGRRYCQQMTSCSEAKYFLANCPNVKMDGDRDGIPCEDQWCR